MKTWCVIGKICFVLLCLLVVLIAASMTDYTYLFWVR
jgi:general stress protein CsbA